MEHRLRQENGTGSSGWGGQHSNPGEMMVSWTRVVAKRMKQMDLRCVSEGDGQDLSVDWSVSTGGL